MFSQPMSAGGSDEDMDCDSDDNLECDTPAQGTFFVCKTLFFRFLLEKHYILQVRGQIMQLHHQHDSAIRRCCPHPGRSSSALRRPVTHQSSIYY